MHILNSLTCYTSFILLATEYHLGLLKAKLAKYRQQLLEPTGKAGAKVSLKDNTNVLALNLYSLLIFFKISPGTRLFWPSEVVKIGIKQPKI